MVCFLCGFFLVWADHGDDISIQYSGTGALKGDFVRYVHFYLDMLLCTNPLCFMDCNS